MKVVLLTNILTPYRKNLYDSLYEEFKKKDVEFHVLVMAETEPNRSWQYNKFKTNYTKLLDSKTIKINKLIIHINFNYKKILKKLNPDIVIASGAYVFPAVWTSIRLKVKLNYKLLFWSESHLNETREYSNVIVNFREKIRRKIYSQFDGFWFAGKLSKEFIKKYASPDAEYFFLPNLVSEHKFYEANSLRKDKKKLRHKWSLSPDKFIFISPARLTKVKGIIPFMNLFIKTKYKKNVTILIAGEGELEDNIIDFGYQNNLDIKLLGRKSEKEIIELYALSDAFLMPSISDPNPLTSIEAAWAGLPLLVSEHVGNHPEIVKENKNGYVFSYLAPDEAVLLIEKMIDSDETWLDNAQRVSTSIAKNIYSTKKITSNLVESMIKLERH